MAENKKSFILYTDLIHTLDKMPDDKAGALFKHILAYVNDKDPTTEDLIIELTFEPIKQQLKRDLRKYEFRAERSRINGSLGGRPKNPEEPKKPSGLKNNPEEPRKPDSDNDSDTVTTNVVGKANLKDFHKRLQEGEYQSRIEATYMKHRLRKNTLGMLIKDFDLSNAQYGKEHPNLNEYVKHFVNWLNIQESNGKLLKHKA